MAPRLRQSPNGRMPGYGLTLSLMRCDNSSTPARWKSSRKVRPLVLVNGELADVLLEKASVDTNC
jgi:hypothetical protein